MTEPHPGAVPNFDVAPWQLSISGMQLESLAESESLFTLANGHIGLRGTLDEGEPRVHPGTFVNGFYEERPLLQAERAYGAPESSQTIVNAPDGKLIRMFVGDSPMDLRYGTVHAHRRTLDLRDGVLRRRTEWTSPNGLTVRITSQRLVSFQQRALAAIDYQVEAIDGEVYVVLQSDLLANEPTLSPSNDPRDAAVLSQPLVPELVAAHAHRAVVVHRTQRSGLRLASGMHHEVHAPEHSEAVLETEGDLARLTVTSRLVPGEKLHIVKFLAYGWSSRRSASALRDQVDAALAVGHLAGWEGLLRGQRAYLDEFWSRADVEIDGDLELQQAVRVAMFHVLQAAARAEGQPVPAKGLTGTGYDGHTFWDAETFVLPMLTYTVPHAARDVLAWRHATLPQARQRAAVLGLAGAAFPWRTIHGEECSGYWPAGTAAFHIAADIANATARYLAATGDTDFERDYGVELLVETARLWVSLGHFASDGQFRIDGVTGPDEYTAVVDDNVYTNLMAQRNLVDAAEACERLPAVARRLGVEPGETKVWRAAAEAMAVPYDESLGVHPQSEDYTEHAEWDFDLTPAEDYPLLLHYPYFQLYRKQVTKQADLVLAMHLRGDAFTPEEKARNFAYYEARTVRDSSLSAATQAVLAAEVGHLRLAYDYWIETAFTDLHDLHGNVDDGLHIAAMAGAWTVAVAGFGGMRDHDKKLTFAPRLPPALRRIAFRMVYRGRVIAVSVERVPGPDGPLEQATYQLLSGAPIETAHHGTPIELTEPGRPVTVPVPPAPQPAPVRQPAGRAPRRRRPARHASQAARHT